jgi:26S proteasome regulatory subunit N1
MATEEIATKQDQKALKPEKKPEEEISEEDEKLKNDLELLVERLTETDAALYAQSLDKLKEFISSSTTSMTAVPKPLKFLHPHYEYLVKAFESWTDSDLKSRFADILSVLSMTHSDDGEHDALKFRLISQEDNYTDWGHEYIRHLALEIGEASDESLESDEPKFDETEIKKIVLKIVPFFLKHNQEADAVDLLLETDNISELPQFVDKNIFKRVGLYLVSCVPLLPPPDDLEFLQTAYAIYLEHGELTQALALAIRIDNEELIEAVFNATEDLTVKKQLALMLSKQYSAFKNEEVQDLIDNRRLSEKFHYVAKELNLLDAKAPEDVYKSHLESVRHEATIDSAKQNLASSFVNAFLNLGYGTDKLLTENDNWIYKTKGDGKLSTVASLGSIHQWDIDGLQILDKYLYSSEEEIKAGALLGMGLVGAGVHDEVESVLLLLQDYVTNSNKKLAMSAILGLALSYSGSQNEDLLNLLLPLVSNLEVPIEVSVLSALALGHAFVGTCNGEITSTILQTLLERDFEQLENKWIKFLALGLGLLYMGKAEQVDDVLETIRAVEHPISKSLEVLTRISAYAGTGNVLEIQGLFDILTPKGPPTEESEKDDDGENIDTEATEKQKEDDDGDIDIIDSVPQPIETAPEQSTENKEGESGEADEETEEEEEKKTRDDESLAYAVLGIAIIALGEDIGKAMSLRHYGHLLDYGSDSIRRAVPLGVGLLSTANPQVNIIESLSRMSHDQDIDVAINAIFAMGLIGSGTNNARLAQLFRQLAAYHRDGNALFATRVAQGLTHLGKGTLTLNPFTTEGRILSKVTLASLMTVAVAFLDPSFILEHHYLLYFLSSAARPRVLITVDEDLNELPVTVRVGKAVDVVGQAGNPKTITGWVTQTTPVLLGYGEKAELEENSEYIALSSFLDGIVILKKNPDYVEADK